MAWKILGIQGGPITVSDEAVEKVRSELRLAGDEAVVKILDTAGEDGYSPDAKERGLLIRASGWAVKKIHPDDELHQELAGIRETLIIG